MFISSALPSPTSRGSRWVPPKPGMMPRLISGWPKVADSAATRKSHAIASSQPPPKAIELTAAIVAVEDDSMPRMKRCADSTSSAPSASGLIFVNSLMSAPALKVKMLEEAITSARAFPSTSSQTEIRSRTACGESGLAGGRLSHAIAMSPRVSSSTVSRWSPASTCGYGKKPWPVFLPSRPCATRRRSSTGGSKASPHSRSARSSCSRMVSSPASSARANGPGRMPAPIIIPISMSLAEATPSSRTRQASTRVLRPIRWTRASVVALAVLIEAPPGLLAEVSRLHQLLHPIHHVEALAVRLAQVLGHVERGVEAGPVGEEERAHRDRAGVLEDLVDLQRVEPLLLDDA